MTQLITKEIAVQLHDALIADRSLSEFHDLPSYEQAAKVLGSVGLGHILVPVRRSTSAKIKTWDLKLFVTGEQPGTELEASEASRVYAVCGLEPMTTYIGELLSCNLWRPWWAAPNFFSAMAGLLAPGYAWADGPPGRAHNGDRQRRGFSERFREIWLDGEHEPKPLEPQMELPLNRMRYSIYPVLPVPQEST